MERVCGGAKGRGKEGGGEVEVGGVSVGMLVHVNVYTCACVYACVRVHEGMLELGSADV